MARIDCGMNIPQLNVTGRGPYFCRDQYNQLLAVVTWVYKIYSHYDAVAGETLYRRPTRKDYLTDAQYERAVKPHTETMFLPANSILSGVPTNRFGKPFADREVLHVKLKRVMSPHGYHTRQGPYDVCLFEDAGIELLSPGSARTYQQAVAQGWTPPKYTPPKPAPRPKTWTQHHHECNRATSPRAYTWCSCHSESRLQPPHGPIPENMSEWQFRGSYFPRQVKSITCPLGGRRGSR